MLPYAAPKAIKTLIPPSTGMHGGGQHGGVLPPEGPPGGVPAGCAYITAETDASNTMKQTLKTKFFISRANI
mgnify:CR=1 FL=1